MVAAAVVAAADAEADAKTDAGKDAAITKGTVSLPVKCQLVAPAQCDSRNGAVARASVSTTRRWLRPPFACCRGGCIGPNSCAISHGDPCNATSWRSGLTIGLDLDTMHPTSRLWGTCCCSVCLSALMATARPRPRASSAATTDHRQTLRCTLTCTATGSRKHSRVCWYAYRPGRRRSSSVWALACGHTQSGQCQSSTALRSAEHV